jgi:hypothetical protein
MMATDESRSSSPGVDGVRDYTLLSLASLLILGLLLFLEGLGLWAMIPVLVGCVSVLRAKGGGPAVTLFLLLLVLAFNWSVGLLAFYRMPSSALGDALAGVMLLLYVVSHARLLSLKAHAVPGDARRGFVPRDRRVRGRWLLPATETRRPASKVEPAEFVWLLAGVPVFLALAFFVWISVLALSVRQTYWLFPYQLRALILTWIGGIALLLGYAANAYLGRTRASREESLLYLQDRLWDETRGEQQRINQRVVEARLRRKERP